MPQKKQPIERLKIFLWEDSLDTGTEYSLEDLERRANEGAVQHYKYYTMNPERASSFTFTADSEWDYGDYNTKFVIKYYRLENDEEYKKRCDQLREQEKRSAEAIKRNQEAAEAKAAKIDQLKADPDYETFVKLKSKFHEVK